MAESQGYAQVTSPFEMIQNPNQIRAKTTMKTKSGKREKASPVKREKAKSRLSQRIEQYRN